MSDKIATTAKPVFFTDIVGLRIYLALWVAVGHGLQLSGFLERSNPLFSLLLRGHDAVILFMIVSGFVITNLLIVKQESYSRYIVRRFFRLYPAFVLACVAGYLLIDDWYFIVQNVPWQSAAWSSYSRGIGELQAQATTNLPPHMIAHALMIHGAIPNEVLSRSAMTLLPAAWSISLEWQFYLVAPLVIAAFGSRWRMSLIAVASLILLILYRKSLLGSYDSEAVLVANTHFFLIGIASRLAYDHLSTFKASPLIGALLSVFLAVALTKAVLPIAIWGAFLCYSLWHREAPVTGHMFRWLTQSRPAQILGEASYSLYLVHRPVQVALAATCMTFIQVNQWTMLAIQMAAIGIALPISVVIYFTVERWGIRMGQKIAARIPDSRAPARAFPPPVAIEG